MPTSPVDWRALPSICVLDVMMPGESGLELTRALRSKGGVPSCCLPRWRSQRIESTGSSTGPTTIIQTFQPRELVLRIRNVLQRPTGGGCRLRDIRFGGCRFDVVRGEFVSRWRCRASDCRRSRLLSILVKKAGQAVSREELSVSFSGNVRNVDVQMTRLRRKIERDPRFPRYLQTVPRHRVCRSAGLTVTDFGVDGPRDKTGTGLVEPGGEGEIRREAWIKRVLRARCSPLAADRRCPADIAPGYRDLVFYDRHWAAVSWRLSAGVAGDNRLADRGAAARRLASETARLLEKAAALTDLDFRFEGAGNRSHRHPSGRAARRSADPRDAGARRSPYRISTTDDPRGVRIEVQLREAVLCGRCTAQAALIARRPTFS